jgi:hypothetical protein
LRINGSYDFALDGRGASPAGYAVQSVVTSFAFAVNDYIETYVYQDTGANRFVVASTHSPVFWCQRLSE